MERWEGKVAVVTGASAGIGFAIVENLLNAGIHVVGLARRLDIMEKSFTEKNYRGKFYPIKCDLRKEEDILAVFDFVEKKFETLHILINNAGILSNEKIIESSTETFRNILDVNVLAVAICSREAIRLMLKHKVQGHIININSLAGHKGLKILIPVNLYPASKFALTGMTDTLRTELELVQSGIKITSISPGAVKTDMIKGFMSDEIYESLQILESVDIADAVSYALSTPPRLMVNELTITPTFEHLSSFVK